MDAEKLRKLRPAFKEGGSVTAGNASSIRFHFCDVGYYCLSLMVPIFKVENLTSLYKCEGGCLNTFILLYNDINRNGLSKGILFHH